MQTSFALKSLLIVSGILAIGIGAALTFAPIAMEASIGLHLGSNANLLSEIRASGGGLLAGGLLILSGAFLPRMAFTSIVISMMFYLGYGFARVFSIVVDGMPASPLVQAAGLEIFIGLLSGIALSRYRRTT